MYRKIKSSTMTTLILSCIITLFVFLIFSMIILALLVLYLPFHNFIPVDLNQRTYDLNVFYHISSISPRGLNDTIDQSNWPDVSRMVENSLDSKLKKIQFTDLSTVRLVDSLPSSSLSQPWCKPNGCLEIIGKIHFPMTCFPACQRRKLDQIANPNTIEPPTIMVLSSIMDASYLMEFDAFITFVIQNGDNGDTIERLLMYNLAGKQERDLSTSISPIDTSSFVNLTRLVNISVIESEMNISQFMIHDAYIDTESSILNVMVLFVFSRACSINCQETQVQRLNHTSSNNFQTLGIVYDGNTHIRNVSFIGIFDLTMMVLPTPTVAVITNDDTSIDNFIGTTSSSDPKLAKSIFEVFYRLKSDNFIINGTLSSGPITDRSTIDDLTKLMQTTVSEYPNISATVFNATISIEENNSTISARTLDAISYILQMIVYYVYPMACDSCVEQCDNAIHTVPHLSRSISIKNGILIDIHSPSLVINLTPLAKPTTLLSTHSNLVSVSHIGLSTMNAHQVTMHSSTTHQHFSTGHSSTVHHTSEHTSTSSHPSTSS